MKAYAWGMSTTPKPQTPSPWPDKPLICVVSGCYRLEGGGLLVPDTGDVIETWEEMQAVPVYRALQTTASPLRSKGIHGAASSAP